MREIVLATNNPNKVCEAQVILENAGVSVRTLAELGITCEPVEDGGSFLANARIKARAAFEATGLPSLADDSGLCVDALGGIPGVESAYFAPPGQHADALLERMRGISDRKAHYTCFLVLVLQDGSEIIVTEKWHGDIGHEKRGTNGWHFDPVFVSRENGLTVAEMTTDEKNTISHRGRAFRKMAEAIIGYEKGIL